MLEQLATYLGIPIKLVFVGLLSGLLMVAYKSKGSIFTKILYVIVCVFFSGYSDQLLKLIGMKFDEDTQIMRGFIVSFISTYLIEGLKLQGEKFSRNPIKYFKSLTSKNNETDS